jgi:hypothetical protein
MTETTATDDTPLAVVVARPVARPGRFSGLTDSLAQKTAVRYAFGKLS